MSFFFLIHPAPHGNSILSGAGTFPVTATDGTFHTHLSMEITQKPLSKYPLCLIILHKLCTLMFSHSHHWLSTKFSHDGKFQSPLPSDKFSHDSMFILPSPQTKIFHDMVSSGSQGLKRTQGTEMDPI